MKQENEDPCMKMVGKTKLSCQEFKNLVDAILDGEATEEEKKHFHEHSEQCNPCAEKYELDQSFFDTVRKKICREEVPSDLIANIRSVISTNNI